MPRIDNPVVASLVEGASFAGYRLERLIGRGGMGAVWLATDTRLGRSVAIKFLPLELAGDERFRARFLAESRLAASLDHPHIVPVYEAGEADGELFIAMRYVEGVTLDTLIRSEGPLEPARAVGLLRGIADALDAAHLRGLVHRDVKPGNVLVSRTPSGEHSYLSDFGLTKRLGSNESLTRTGQVIGSVDYIAPEQVEGRPVDGRADVYSLGCVLYAAVVGHAPYPRDSEVAVLWAHVQAVPPQPSSIRPGLAPLDPVIERALTKDPSARFPTAGALIAAAVDAIRTGTTRGFLFADLRGYTAYVERHGDAAAASLLDRYRSFVRSVVASHEGAEIRTEGDSFYVVFPSASRAVAAGLAITEEAGRRSQADPDHPIAVGVGIHAGETADTLEGPVGSAVNIAARICSQARPGEVLVSDTVRNLVRTSMPVGFTDRGRRSVKGLAEPLRLFAASRSEVLAPRPSRVRLGPSLRGVEFGTPGWIAAALAVLGLAALAVVLGSRLGSTPGASPPNPSTGPSAGASPSGVVGATGGDWIAYMRRSRAVDGSLDCSNLRPDLLARAAEIRVVADDGSSDRRLNPRSGMFEFEPTWRPDGTTLAFVGDSGSTGIAIWEVRPDGEGLARLIYDDVDFGPMRSPTWSNDGRIAWVSVGNALSVANGDGSGRRRLTLWPEAQETPADLRVIDVSWLPDGQLGVVGAGTEDDLAPGKLHTATAEGTDLAELGLPGAVTVSQAAWSPDGEAILLTVGEGGAHDIAVLRGSELRNLTASTSPPGTTNRDPAWSPDGRRVAFASDRTGTFEIYVVDVEGGEPQQVTTTETSRASCAPSWGRLTAPLPSPSPSPGPGEMRDLAVGWLGAGSYRPSRFEPSFEVTVPEAWEAWVDSVDGVWLRKLGTTAVEILIGQVNIAYTNGCQDQPRELAPRTSRDLIEWLQAQSLLTVSDPEPVDFGGAPAIAVNVTGGGQPTCIPVPRIFLFDIAESNLFVRPGETVRLIGADVDGRLVVAIPRGDETVYPTLVKPVLDSIKFAER
jgi:class 3 adenylate cyclase